MSLTWSWSFHCTAKVPSGVGSSGPPGIIGTGPRVTVPADSSHARRVAMSTHARAELVHGVPATTAPDGVAVEAGAGAVPVPAVLPAGTAADATGASIVTMV